MLEYMFNTDLNDDFDDNEPEIDAVSVEGMRSIIDAIEGGIESVPTTKVLTESLRDGNGNIINPSDDQNASKQQPEPSGEPSSKQSSKQSGEQSGEQSNKPSGEQSGKPSGEPSSTEQQAPEIGAFELQFPKVADGIKRRYKSSPEDGQKLIKFLNKHVKQIAEKLKTFGDENVTIDTKLVGALTNYYNGNQKDKITLPFRTANTANINQETNTVMPKEIPIIKIPKGFNQPPSVLGEFCTSNRFGFPMINFASGTVKELLKPAEDIGYLKTLVKEFVKEIKNTPIAKALGNRTMFGGWKSIIQRVRNCGRAKCIPIVHKPLKITGGENIETLFNGTQNSLDGGNNTVFVNPINTRSTQITESVNPIDEQTLTEGLLDKFRGETQDKNYFMDGPEIEVPIPYLTQFYQINKPSSPQGMEKYTRYMSKENLDDICNAIGPEAVEEAKKSNMSFKAAILYTYVKMNDGILPYYILTPRDEPKELLKVTPKPLLNGMYLVKSVDGPNKATGYFISTKEREQLFDLG